MVFSSRHMQKIMWKQDNEGETVVWKTAVFLCIAVIAWGGLVSFPTHSPDLLVSFI